MEVARRAGTKQAMTAAATSTNATATNVQGSLQLLLELGVEALSIDQGAQRVLQFLDQRHINSIGTQRYDRVDRRCPACRHQASDHAGQHEHRTDGDKGERIAGCRFVKQPGDHLPKHERTGKTD